MTGGIARWERYESRGSRTVLRGAGGAIPPAYSPIRAQLPAQRSITVTYETIRQWCLTFGAAYARTLRHRRGRQGDAWHLDELFVTLNGRLHYLWRAVDEDGDVLDILVQSRRNRRARGAILPEVAETPRLCPSSTDHRQASQLPGGVP